MYVMLESQMDAIATSLIMREFREFELDFAEGVQTLLMAAGASHLVFEFTGVDPEIENEGTFSVDIRFNSPGVFVPRLQDLFQQVILPAATRAVIREGKQVLASIPRATGHAAPADDNDDGAILLDIEIAVRCSESSRYAEMVMTSWSFTGGMIPENYSYKTVREHAEPAPEMGS